MRKLFYMGLEPYEGRYTLQLQEWSERAFERRNIDYTVVPGTTIDDTKSISVGQVLDAHGRSYFGMSQMMNLVQMMRNGDCAGEDVIFFEDMFQPGIESLPYIEAVRQLRYDVGRANTLSIHLTLVPYLSAARELKTKPTQHSVKTLSESGLQPDIIVARSEHALDDTIRNKIAQFCNVEYDDVIASLDAESIYQVPLLMQDEGLDKRVIEKLKLGAGEADLERWKGFVEAVRNPSTQITIALVGKYVEHHDAYKSIVEALIHGGAVNDCEVNIRWIQSDDLTADNVGDKLEGVSGVLVAPGFGGRGIDGKLAAANYSRKNEIPYFGICLGMQCAVIEFARNVCGWETANSTEFDEDTEYPIIDLMPDQKNIEDKGGTMRLGLYDCKMKKDSKVYEAYGKELIQERHRHRYEVNNNLRYKLVEDGMKLVGFNPERDLVEIIELPDHPWFVGVQFHPEYCSTVNNPQPLFVDFVKTSLKHAKDNNLAEPIKREKIVIN